MNLFSLQIIVYWPSTVLPPPTSQWPYLSKMQKRASHSKMGKNLPPIHVITSIDHLINGDNVFRPHQEGHKMTQSSRFLPNPLIQTQAILSLDDDAAVTAEEIDFAFGVWKHFPDRIVGYPARSHYYGKNMVTKLPYDEYYNDLYTEL